MQDVNIIASSGDMACIRYVCTFKSNIFSVVLSYTYIL